MDLLLQLYNDLINAGIVSAISFSFLAVVVLGSAVAVVIMRNLVHSVLWLAVTMIGIAGIFVTLNAEYLAVVQILVYAGAVCVMVIFGVMITQQGGTGRSSLFNRQVHSSLLVGVATLVVTIALSVQAKWPVSTAEVPADTVGNIALVLLSKYVIPFEVAALLLLVALFGAIVIAREVECDD
ncbi:MAG TPA: NADH-quinone oxidoreductase subunit J [Clostridia bacterium]|nr:NADH-quinone oxidoreductase subunit J [Clostridia bacterium]